MAVENAFPLRQVCSRCSFTDVQRLFPVAGGFPSGQYRIESRLLEIELAVKDGATEIDTVINRAAALDGDWNSKYLD